MSQTKKTNTKKVKTTQIFPKSKKKEMRFNISLVILIGMLTFSLMLLSVSLNKSFAKSASTTKIMPARVPANIVIKKNTQVSTATFSDGSNDFQLTIPADWNGWIYKVGQVKSSIDDSLSNPYVKLYLPDPSQNSSSNFDVRNKNIVTIIKFSADEWKKLDKGCQKGNDSYCGSMGTKLGDAQPADSAGGSGFVYGYTKTENCTGSLAAKCGEVDKILQSFQVK